MEFSAEVKQSADKDQEAPRNEEAAAEFAEGIHRKEVEEMKQRSNEVRTQEQGKRGTM